jgi:predicted RNase H-like HicB family nuclease
MMTMKYYYAVVHKDEDSSYGLHFPDLPGCYSAADSMDDIVPNALEALSLYVEGEAEETPKPSDIAAIRTLAADDLASGAFLVMVPFIGNSGKPARINISIDTAVLDAIDQAASQRKLTRSAFIAEAARHEIERQF